MDKPCLRCGTMFYAKKPSNKFCVRACYDSYRTENRPIRPCKAAGCGKTFILHSLNDDKVFCSRACANTVTRKKEIKTCRRCKSPLTNRQSTYCGSQCHNEYKYEEYIRRWLAGEESGGTKFGCSSVVRRWIRSLYGLFCWECGWCKPHPLTGEPPLQIDHIDGDASNNRPENLRLLCGGCHSLTPTYGNYGGRKSARTYRYDKNGK